MKNKIRYKLEKIDDSKYRKLYILKQDLDIVANNIQIHIPKDFVTDLASVPYIFHWLIHQYGKHELACLVHDYLYSPYKTIPISRSQADRIMLEIMKENEVKFVKRYVLYYAVRLFGKGRYTKYYKQGDK